MAEHFGFILSGGRTGTAFLGDLASQIIANCHSEHEPDVFYGFDRLSLQRLRRYGLWHMVIGRALGRTGVRVLGTRYLTGKATREETITAMREQRRSYHASIGEKLVIESNYAWWMVVDLLDLIFPNSRSVGIIRDPRSWIPSWMARAPRRASGQLIHILPPGPINAITVHDGEWADKWPQMSAVARLAWQWKFINGTLMRCADAGKLRIFRFEDVFDTQTRALDDLCKTLSSFADRDYHHSGGSHLLKIKRNTSSAGPEAWREWSRDDRDAVRMLCGPLMERLGYSPL